MKLERDDFTPRKILGHVLITSPIWGLYVAMWHFVGFAFATEMMGAIFGLVGVLALGDWLLNGN